MQYSTLIDCNSLSQHLDEPDWIIFDVRYDLTDKNAGRNAYVQSHIPGSIYVDLHDDLSGPPITNRGRHPLPTTAAMYALFSRFGITPDTQVIVYDAAGGSFAARLWWMLQHLHHVRVAVLDGGWQAWFEANYPVDNTARPVSNSQFEQSAKENDVVTIEQVEDFDCIVDSRDPERYRGEIEPIDKAAGHIPGALNRCWKNNLSESGKFKEKQVLKDEFEKLFKGINPAETVFYCGSGVTACHNLLSVVHAGLEMPKLYAGSWSEWSSTTGKSVATGDD